MKYGKLYEPSWAIEVEIDFGGFTEIVTPCVYCGEAYAEVEHVVPESYISSVAQSLQRFDLWTYLVPACSQCNHIAGSKVFSSPSSKRDYIQKRIKDKYFKARPWTLEELDSEEIIGNLRTYIVASGRKNENFLRRFTYEGVLPPSLGHPELRKFIISEGSAEDAAENPR